MRVFDVFTKLNGTFDQERFGLLLYLASRKSLIATGNRIDGATELSDSVTDTLTSVFEQNRGLSNKQVEAYVQQLPEFAFSEDPTYEDILYAAGVPEETIVGYIERNAAGNHPEPPTIIESPPAEAPDIQNGTRP